MKAISVIVFSLGFSALLYAGEPLNTDNESSSTTTKNSINNLSIEETAVESVPDKSMENEFSIDDLDDYEINSRKNTQQTSDWHKHFSGSLGSFNSYGSDNSETHIDFLKLKYGGQIGALEYNIEGVAPSIDIQFSHIKANADSELSEQDRINFGYKDKSPILSEAYLSGKPTPWSKLSAGRSIIVWGQFPSLSPANLVFPINFTPTEISANKVSFTLPQDNISLSLFPGKHLAITAYYFPHINFHPILKEGKIDADLDKYMVPIIVVPEQEEKISSYSEQRENSSLNLPIASPPTSPAPQENVSTAIPIPVPTPDINYNDIVYEEAYINDSLQEIAYIQKDVGMNLPPKSKAAQYALRAMYYYGDTSFGISYYDGWDVNRVSKFNTLETLSLDVGDLFYVDQNLGVAKQRALSLEYSTIINGWTFAAEAILSSGHENLRYYDAPDSTERQAYREWLIKENKQQLHIKTSDLIYGLGLSKNFSRWDINFALFSNYIRYSEHAAEGLVRQHAAFPFKEEATSASLYPVFDIKRYLNKHKDSSLSMTAGVLGYGYGASLSYNHMFYEALECGISLRRIHYFLDDILVPGKYDEDYKMETGSNSTIAFNLNYVF